MKKGVLALILVHGLLVGACADIEKTLHGPGNGNPPIGHLPGKADLIQCTASDCDQVPVNIKVVNGVCTVPFVYQKVVIQPGVTARFGFAVLTPEYIFRFTDPSLAATPGDPAGQLPAIDIDYRGMPAAFSVGYPATVSLADKASGRPPARAAASVSTRAVSDSGITKYDVFALPGGANKDIYYSFKIHAEWSADSGATWQPCVEKDPVIANN